MPRKTVQPIRKRENKGIQKLTPVYVGGLALRNYMDRPDGELLRIYKMQALTPQERILHTEIEKIKKEWNDKHRSIHVLAEKWPIAVWEKIKRIKIN